MLTVQEFAKRIHYSERRVRQKIHSGEIEAIPFGRKWLIPESQIFAVGLREELKANILQIREELGLPRKYIYVKGRHWGLEI